MAKLEHSVVIKRPIEQVFRYTTDIEMLPQWMTDLIEAKQSSQGPVGVGTTVNAVANPLGRRVESTQEITDYEPNQIFAFKSTSGGVESKDKFTFESVSGGTKVTRQTEAEVGGFFRMAEPLVVRMLNRQFDTNFSNLKDILESQAESPA